MLYTFTGNGNGTTQYNNEVVEINNTTPDEVQNFLDEWVKKQDDEVIDQFGDLDTDKVAMEDIISAMPNEWEVKIINDQTYTLFV